MAKNNTKPQIRFKGFTDAWEQRKFAEVYSLASEGGTPDTNIDAYYLNGTIPFVRIEDTENKYIDSVKTFITEEGLKHSSAWLIPSGSVIFTNGATVGNVAINRIPVATKQGILGIIPNKTVTAEYLYYLLSAGFFQREVRNRQATGTFATIILKNLNEINVFVPDKLEQRKISDYLSSIDNLITLHQRKYEKFINIKKALLEKMFPQGDEKVPRIRFKGFTDAWEQRKLKQVATIQKGEQLSKAKLDSVGKYYVLNGGMEPSGFCDEYNAEPNTISISEGGNSCGYVALNLDRFWSGGHNYTLQNLRIDTDFLFQCLKGIETKIMALRVGSGLPNIQKAAIDGVDIIFPLEDEQKSIGHFLTKLSNLITLHQRQVEKLKNIKSALLEKMFV